MSCSSRSLISLLLLGVVLGGCDKRSAQNGQANAASQDELSSGSTTGEVSSGEVTAGEVASGTGKAPGKSYSIDRGKAGSPLPDFVFSDEKAQDVTLKRFAGRPILINLWATWCAPCVAEMPQLDRIAGAYGKNGAKDGLEVLTISQDSMGADKVVPFFNAKGFRHIKPWLDPENQFGFHYGTGLLPTSVLYDAQGKEIARVTGALDWEGDEAKALIAEAMGG